MAASRLIWTPASTGAVAAVAVGAVTLATATTGGVAALDAGFAGRVAIIAAFAVAAITAQTTRTGSRLGQVLGATTLWCGLWMLNVASWAPARAVGTLSSMIAPVVLSYVMLAYPAARLHGREDRLLLAVAGGILVTGSLAAAAIAWHPRLWPPLHGCAPSCPNDVFGLTLPGGSPQALRLVVVGSWWVLWAATAALVLGRGRSSAPLPIARALLPMRVVAVAAAAVSGVLVARSVRPDPGDAVDAALAGIAVLVALAIVLGLAMERLCVARAGAHRRPALGDSGS